MAKVTNIDQQQRVVIPPPTKLPPNLHITGGLTSRLLTTPSETDSAITQRTRFEAREDKALRYKLLQFDQRSFMWCIPNLDNELSHRGNSFPIKEEVLSRQMVQNDMAYKFQLDRLDNAILCELDNHVPSLSPVFTVQYSRSQLPCSMGLVRELLHCSIPSRRRTNAYSPAEE